MGGERRIELVRAAMRDVAQQTSAPVVVELPSSTLFGHVLLYELTRHCSIGVRDYQVQEPGWQRRARKGC